ncbi:MAG TPA: c-type cytochrome [Candidatus Eisenbacteria bacterium]|jgi:mono/diheme cytochrome c family protein|nr:c-type cytochrome [Candidatus Eisenbacteria bacterium]
MMRLPQRMIPAAVIAAPLIALALASCSRPASQETTTQPAAEDSIARGRYLVAVAGCNDCHTPGYFYNAPDTTRLLSGSEVGWMGPWGVSYARNITPDDSTGIGTWTADQIVTAIRTGQRPDGSHILLPPMPWPDFSHLTDKDAYAIAAYLKSIPPVRHVAPAIVPPGKKPTTPYIPFPKPSAWDAPRPAGGNTPAAGGSGTKV